MTPALADLEDQGGLMDLGWLREDHPGELPADPATIAELRDFLMLRWTDRALELGHPPPHDLSSSCKFGALLCKALLGGCVRGNHDHVHAFVEGRVVDLSEGAADVLALSDPYRDDPAFLAEDAFLDSLESCLPRVGEWVAAFLADRKPAP